MTTVTQGPKWKKADLAWLGLAVATHAGLLLLPLGEPVGKPPSPQRLSLELVNWRAEPEPVVAETADSKSVTVTPVHPQRQEPGSKDLPPEAPTLSMAPLQDEAGPDIPARNSEPGTPTASRDHLTAALLLNAVGKRERVRAESDSPQTPGVHSPRGMPANWQRGNRTDPLPTDQPRLGIAMAPAQTEIVDRWLDAQGGHNVVVTLPNGDTYCGRAQAWDPMQSLVEHIMMFRPCGGGGKRTFDMASRPTPRWSTAE